jgi:hypothetical protein
MYCLAAPISLPTVHASHRCQVLVVQVFPANIARQCAKLPTPRAERTISAGERRFVKRGH